MEIGDGEEVISNTTFAFPIRYSNEDAPMKNIRHSSLPNFHELTNDDLDTFLFEFDVLCCGYDYINDVQNLKLFPATLKEESLRGCMVLVGKSIWTLNDMKQQFLTKF